jgi:hypothetical protein
MSLTPSGSGSTGSLKCWAALLLLVFTELFTSARTWLARTPTSVAHRTTTSKEATRIFNVRADASNKQTDHLVLRYVIYSLSYYD